MKQTPQSPTLRRETTQALAKSLAHQKAGHADKADSWARKLVDALRKGKLLRQQ